MIAIRSQHGWLWDLIWWWLNYDLYQGDTCVGHIERAKAKILGEIYSLVGMGSFFAIESNGGHLLARAETKSILFPLSFDVHVGETDYYVLQAKTHFSDRFELIHNGLEIGSLTLEGFRRRRATIDLPETLSPPVQGFLFWLTIYYPTQGLL
jgi:hypothetical protein